MNYMHRFTHTVVALLLVSGVSSSLYATATSLDTYHEAQLQENTSQDPESALKLYTDFLKTGSGDRAIDADAWLHLGLCQTRVGHNSEAKTTWQKIVQDYADQSIPYSQALRELQTLQAAEAPKIQIIQSTPVIKTVYAPYPTRWNLEFLRFPVLHVIDSKGRFMESNVLGIAPSFDYYLKPGHLAIGFSGGSTGLGGDRSSLLTFNPHVRIEHTGWGPFIPYASAGPSFYRFKFKGTPVSSTLVSDAINGNYYVFTQGETQEENHWTVGATGEAGVVIGSTRGFTLNLGYSLHIFPQVTPSAGFQQAIGPSTDAPEQNQNHGLRWIGGPVFALAFRW